MLLAVLADSRGSRHINLDFQILADPKDIGPVYLIKIKLSQNTKFFPNENQNYTRPVYLDKAVQCNSTGQVDTNKASKLNIGVIPIKDVFRESLDPKSHNSGIIALLKDLRIDF